MPKDLPLDVAVFKDLFVNREDTYSVQNSDGNSYLRINRPLDRQNIIDHMLGKQTIGLYQLKDNKIKWALIDIDINKEVWSQPGFKVEDWKDKVQEQALKIQETLSKKGVKSYREFSGFKGEHVWIFFDKPTSAALVKNALETMFKNMPLVEPNHMHIEIFPKQAHATDVGPGSLVKAPLGKHQRSKTFSTFIDDISNIEFVKEENLNKATNEFDAIFQNCGALRDVRDEGIHSEHLGHDERLALAYIFGNLGKEGVDYVEEELFSKLSDYDPTTTRYHLDRILTKGYRPINCQTLQDKGICPGPCAAIGMSKSPITFYYRQRGVRSDEEEMESTSRLDQYEMKSNSYYETNPANQKAMPELLSNFVLDLYEQVHIDDGVVKKTIFRGHIVNDEGAHDIEIDANDFASADKLSGAIYAALGNAGTYIGNISKVREASNKYSKKNKINVRKMFGYNEEHTKYYTPTTMITPDGIFDNDELIIDLTGEGQAEMLGMNKIDVKEFEEIKQHIKDDLLELGDYSVTHTALGHAMLPIIEPFIDTGDRTRYIYFVRGQTGSGKSFLLESMQNFYGDFPSDAVTWSSTPNAIQRLGYFFKDAMYLVDDFKLKNLTNYTGAVQVMQNYADMTARSRMTSKLDIAPSYVIKGFLTVTGEDTVAGEASNLARSIIVEYKSNGRDLTRGAKVKKMKHLYRGFTPYYIQYVLNLDKDKVSDTMENYHKVFFEFVKGQGNDVRIARNAAILMTSYYYLSHFLWNKKEAEDNIERIKDFLSTSMQESVDGADAEKSSKRFWNYLQEFIAADKLAIAPSTNTTKVVNFNRRGVLVGFQSAGKTFIMPDSAYGEIQKILRQSGDQLNHGLNAILHDLEADGIIKSSKRESRKLNGKSVTAIEVQFDKPDLVKDEC